MKKTLAMLATLVAAALAAPAALGAQAASTRVFLQRTSDGRVILTDRQLDGARTERTWQVEREDPAAARARSERVHRDAEAVAERIERRLAMQELQAERHDLARREAALRDEEAAGDTQLGTGTVIYPGYGGNLVGPFGRSLRGSFSRDPFSRDSFRHGGARHGSRHAHGPFLRLHFPQAPRPLLTPPF
jgi:hypothetical protein